MNFRRLFQIGGSVLFAALSLALVERIAFEPKIESPVPSETALSAPVLAPIPAPTLAEVTHPILPLKRKKNLPLPALLRSPASQTERPTLAEAEEPSASDANAPETKHETRKNIWFWAGASASRHELRHSLSSGINSRFRSLGAPAPIFRAGFEIENFGFDASYESAPGKVSSAANATVEENKYHWNSLRADATWRGLIQDLRLRLGVEQHTSPFLYPDSGTGKIYLRRARLDFAALGIEWMPQISKDNRLEAKATYLHSLGSHTLDRAEIETKRNLSGHISLGLVHSAGEHFRIGTYLQSEIQSYEFGYRSAPGATQIQGSQKFTSHSLGLRFGWEY